MLVDILPNTPQLNNPTFGGTYLFPLGNIGGCARGKNMIYYRSVKTGKTTSMIHAEQKTAVEIGQLIKSERKRQGVTQMQLAGIAGTGIRFISDLENGKGTIQVQKLLKVLQTLGLGLFIYSPWDNK